MSNGQAMTPSEIEIALAHGRYEDAVNAGWSRSRDSWRNARYTHRRGQDNDTAAWDDRVSDPEPSEELSLDDFDNDVEAYYQAVKALSKAKTRLVDRPLRHLWQLPDDNFVGVVFMGDTHIGGMIDHDQLEADLELIENTQGLYAVGMGDYSDNFESAGKLQHAMSENVVPGSDDQERLVRHVLKRCSKFEFIAEGNHDGWGHGRVVERLAEYVGARYISQAGGALKIRIGDERYVIYVKHKFRGNSNINTSNEGRRFWQEFAEWENADVVVLAHYHTPDTHQNERKGRTVTFLRGGTYKLHDAYAATGGFAPAYGPAMIVLNPSEHEVIPFHGGQWRRGVDYLEFLRKGKPTG